MKKNSEFKSNISSLIIHAYETGDENLKYSLKFLDYFETVKKRFPEYKTVFEHSVHIPEIDEPLFINISYTVPFEYIKDIFDIDWIIQSNYDYNSTHSISAKLIQTNQLDKLNSFVDFVMEQISQKRKDGTWDFDMFNSVERIFFQPILSYENTIRYSSNAGMNDDDIADYEKLFKKTLGLYMNEKSAFSRGLFFKQDDDKKPSMKNWFKNYNNIFSGWSFKNKKEDFASLLISSPKCSNMLKELIDNNDFDLSFMGEKKITEIINNLLNNGNYERLQFLKDKEVIYNDELHLVVKDVSYYFIKSLTNLFTNKVLVGKSMEEICEDFKQTLEFFKNNNLNLFDEQIQAFLAILLPEDRKNIHMDKLLDKEFVLYNDRLSSATFNASECLFLKEMIDHFDIEFSDKKSKKGVSIGNSKYRSFAEFFVFKLDSLISDTEEYKSGLFKTYQKHKVAKWFEEISESLYDNVSSATLKQKIESFIKVKQMDEDLEDKTFKTKKVKI